jgi:hypothetical protein
MVTFMAPVLGSVFGRRAAELGAALDDDTGIDRLLDQLGDVDER